MVRWMLERARQSSPGLPDPVQDPDFIAIDFETANRRRSSACAVGVAIVKNGEVVARGSTLINPECDFEKYNMAITGIGPATVANAPTFEEVWPHLSAILAGQFLVAHVATFDFGVLRQSVARYGSTGIDAQAACTWRLSRLVWTTFPSYGLSFLAKQLQLPLDHHQAGSDAEACAGVVISALTTTSRGSLHDLIAAFEARPMTLTPASFVGLSSAALAGGSTGADERNRTGAEDADPDHPLYGRTLCFTGAMFSMTRNEAVELITAVGANFNKAMSGNVDLLVIGDADFVEFADGMQTGKMKKAVLLREKGDDIEVMAEREFLSLLN